MKWLRSSLAALCLILLSGFWHGTPSSIANFQSVYAIGGGGYSKSIDIANDGTKVSTVDIWGAFVAQPGTSSAWTPLINSTAFSAITTCANNNYPMCWQGDGPYDARIAHSNSQIIFIDWDGQLWRSTNQGGSFASVSGASGLPIATNTADTGGNSPITWCSQGGGTPRLSNPKTNIDPTQATLGSLTVIVPTARSGTYITKNGGTSFSLIATVPTPFPGSGGTTGTTTSSTTSGAVLNFSGGPPSGLTTNYVVVDETHPFSIPPNTFYSSQTSTTVTVSNSVSSTVSSGDVISFYYPGTNGCPQLELVAFDPISSSTIYIADPGSGILVSTNGGTSFSVTTGGTPPAATDVGTSMVVCKDERVYFVDQNDGFVYVYNPSTPAWTKSSQNGIWAVACDPSVTTGTVTAVGASGGLTVSTDHGVTWHDNEGGGNTSTRVATDVPWLAITPEAMNTSEIQYDPQSGLLYMAEGIGVWHTTVSNTGGSSITWTSQTAGIESLQGAGIIKSPAYTYPFMLYWDRAEFSTTNPNSYTAPAVQYPLSGTAGAGNAIVAGWSGDYASSSPGTVCALVNTNFGTTTPISGCTSDGVNWTQFPVEPDMLPLVTSAASSVGSSTLTFSSVPNIIGLDNTRQMNDVGTVAYPASTISSGSNTPSIASLPATVKKGDLVNTAGPGFLIAGAQGFQGTIGSQALIESISGGTLTLNIGASVSIPTTTMLLIQQPLQYKTNQAAPAANDLCFSVFRGDINGITMTGLNVPHATVVSNITSGGACGAGEITVQVSNNLSVTDPGNTIFSFGAPNSPLPGQLVAASGNTGTTLALGSAVAYPNSGSANTDGVRTGETISFASFSAGAMAVSTPNNILYIAGDGGNGGAYWPLYTTDGGSTWHNAILCGSSCGTLPGFDANGRAGNACYTGGFGTHSNFLAADRVRATTFYVFNRCPSARGNGVGVYRSTDGGVTWTQQINSSPSGNLNLGGGAGFVAVPGEQDQLWWSNGVGFDTSHGNDTSGDLYRSCDGGATWYPVDSTNLLNVSAFNFGAPTPGGNGYPSVTIYGNVNGTWGKWRGDNPSTTCGAGQTVTWTQIGNQFLDGQLNIGWLQWLAADTNRYGYYYLNAGGGSVWGYHN